MAGSIRTRIPRWLFYFQDPIGEIFAYERRVSDSQTRTAELLRDTTRVCIYLLFLILSGVFTFYLGTSLSATGGSHSAVSSLALSISDPRDIDEVVVGGTESSDRTVNDLACDSA